MPTSSSIFVDTSGWGCFLDVRETHHADAVALLQQAAVQRRQLVTTNYVIAELVALLSSRFHLPRQELFRAVDTMKATPLLEIVYADAALDDEAWILLKSRLDKQWSLVDATGMIVMSRYGITDVLTTDHHFTQAGYNRLLQL